MAIDRMYRMIREDFHDSIRRWVADDPAAAKLKIDAAIRNATALSEFFGKVIAAKEKR